MNMNLNMNMAQAKSQARSQLKKASFFGPKVLKFSGFFFLLVIFVSLVIYIVSLFFGPQIISVPEAVVDSHVISFARSDLSEREVLAKFGRSTVVGVSDTAYRLKLNNDQFAQFKALNLSYTELPSQFLVSRNGYSIWRVEFYPPVYNSKVQSIANYGSIIKENKDKIIL